ncbi:MAG: DUF1819 family protein [Saccharospirillaceae bacterium]|nr:DUF1819 family protein [Pseudomonadales bacterium]NRB78694.1 DUF1819 family protein [Saccharospirillaceae bacterium]
MNNLNPTSVLKKYDTTINVIGGIKDCDPIFKTINSYFDDNADSNNEFNLRTERSRIRIDRGVRTAFLQFKNKDHQDLIQSIFSSNLTLQVKQVLLFWQFALNNSLFRDISVQVFAKEYISGKAVISKEIIIGFLKDLISNNESLHSKWSEVTIRTLATKYLNFLTKINFVEGARKKTFKRILMSSDLLVLFLYILKINETENRDIYSNEFFPLVFIDKSDIQERLKKISLKGYFNMDFNGVELNIELTHSFKGICDVICTRE